TVVRLFVCFFFSSRRRHTRSTRDWSSDVCSSDLFSSRTAMEPPLAFEANAVRDEKVKVLHAIRPLDGEEIARSTVRGQYTKGWVLGEQVGGYREEKNVAPDSQTETFAGLRLFIDNWRWAGIPFYIRAGKRLPK